DDEHGGEQVVAIVAVRDPATFHADELRAWMRTRISAYKVPRRVVAVSEIRRAANGKADYAWGRDLVAGHARPGYRLRDWMERPPATSRHTPVRKAASSEARNTTALATSLGVARRPIGIPRTMARCTGSGMAAPPNTASSKRVGDDTGSTALTRIAGASSAA